MLHCAGELCRDGLALPPLAPRQVVLRRASAAGRLLRAFTAQVEEIAARARRSPGYTLTVDLEECVITDPAGLWIEFSLEQFRRYRLLNGLDDIGMTLEHEDEIAAYERKVQENPDNNKMQCRK